MINYEHLQLALATRWALLATRVAMCTRGSAHVSVTWPDVIVTSACQNTGVSQMTVMAVRLATVIRAAPLIITAMSSQANAGTYIHIDAEDLCMKYIVFYCKLSSLSYGRKQNVCFIYEEVRFQSAILFLLILCKLSQLLVCKYCLQLWYTFMSWC